MDTKNKASNEFSKLRTASYVLFAILVNSLSSSGNATKSTFVKKDRFSVKFNLPDDIKNIHVIVPIEFWGIFKIKIGSPIQSLPTPTPTLYDSLKDIVKFNNEYNLTLLFDRF